MWALHTHSVPGAQRCSGRLQPRRPDGARVQHACRRRTAVLQLAARRLVRHAQHAHRVRPGLRCWACLQPAQGWGSGLAAMLGGSCPTAAACCRCPVLNGTKWTATKWIHTKPFNEEWLAKPQAPTLEQDPGMCTDAHEMCATWAAAGECDKNPTYMQARPQGALAACSAAVRGWPAEPACSCCPSSCSCHGRAAVTAPSAGVLYLRLTGCMCTAPLAASQCWAEARLPTGGQLLGRQLSCVVQELPSLRHRRPGVPGSQPPEGWVPAHAPGRLGVSAPPSAGSNSLHPPTYAAILCSPQQGNSQLSAHVAFHVVPASSGRPCWSACMLARFCWW